MTDGVVLLHGILLTRRSMGRLERFLQRQGYRTLNLTYPSNRMTLAELAEHIHPAIQNFADSIDGHTHFVGHSMGGLLIRAYLAKHRPARMGRVVCLATPHFGSEIADLMKSWWLYRKIYGPAGAQLVTNWDERDALLPPPDYEIATIAGNISWEPLSQWIIGQPSDGKVSIASTRHPNLADHRVIAATHTFMPHNRTAWQLVQQFLAHGRFEGQS